MNLSVERTILLTLSDLIRKAAFNHPPNSSACVWAARQALEDAYKEGLIEAPVEWLNARTAVVRIGPMCNEYHISLSPD